MRDLLGALIKCILPFALIGFVLSVMSEDFNVATGCFLVLVIGFIALWFTGKKARAERGAGRR